MRARKMQETHRINFVVMLSYSFLTFILLIAYILEMVKGSRTPGYTAVFAILDLLPYIICMFLYRRDRQSPTIKYLFCLGFSILYVFVLLTAAVPTTFVYMFLVFFLIIPYGELKMCYIAGGIAFVANVISVAIGFSSGSLTTDDLAMVEIQVISIALAALFSTFATLVIRRVNVQKLEELNGEKEKIDGLFANALEVSKGISEAIDSVTVRMEHLDQSVAATRDSMQDVSFGANETAEAMQNQLLQTEEIVEHVNKAKEVARVIAEDIQLTENTVVVGKGNIDNLLMCVSKSEEASELLVSKMKELTENTEKMNSIVEMINSVTKQTSLLSLNASIEAARAGEAGRGFAVVAEEISSLAKQTSEATVSITTLIGGITVSIDEVLISINQLMDSNKEQNRSVEIMAENFEKIESSSRSIYEVSDDLENVIEELARSNEKIVQSINSVSAVTEEVSARANETLTDSEKDAMVVDEITKVIIELNDKAKRLN